MRISPNLAFVCVSMGILALVGLAIWTTKDAQYLWCIVAIYFLRPNTEECPHCKKTI